MSIELACVAAAGAGSGGTEGRADGEEFWLLVEQRQQELVAVRAELEETRKELQEVSEALEERSREADESLDKYCALIVRVHKLEETNEMLTARLQRTATSKAPPDDSSTTSTTSTTITTRRSRRLSRRKEVAMEHGAENEAPPLPGSPTRPSPLGKRLHLTQRGATHTPAKAQEDLHNLTKRIKAQATMANRTGGGHDEEFKPEGLPELVKRGATFQWELFVELVYLLDFCLISVYSTLCVCVCVCLTDSLGMLCRFC